MKKTVLFMALAATVALTSCSKDNDDGANHKCESCTASDSKIELCDNGDGTYTLTVGDEESDTVEDLGGLTPKQVAESTCEALKLLPSL